MPFDNSNVMRESAVRDPPVSTDPLERLGITPVPPEFVAHYMRRYQRRFKLLHPLLVLSGPLYWTRVGVASYDADRLRRGLAGGVLGRLSSDTSGAPQALIALAERVRAARPDALFTVAYFYEDPVLFAAYQIGERSRTVCLGIWDKGAIVAIAGTPVPERRGFFATLFGGRSFAE